ARGLRARGLRAGSRCRFRFGLGRRPGVRATILEEGLGLVLEQLQPLARGLDLDLGILELLDQLVLGRLEDREALPAGVLVRLLGRLLAGVVAGCAPLAD